MAESQRLNIVNLIKKPPSKQVQNIFIGLTYVISILLLVFAIVPTVNTILQINKEIKEKQRIHSALEQKLLALSELDEEYNGKNSEFKNLSLLFPATGNFSLFLSNIDAIVSRNNFVLEAISFSEYNRQDYDINTLSLQPSTVRLSVNGKKIYLITLLRDLEAMPMYPVIESVSYSEEVDQDGNTKYILSLRIYSVKNSPKFYD